MAKQPQSCAFRTSIGGQALIEGILMRGPEKQAIVVRDQEGNLVEKVEELRLIKDRHPILGWPLIRGTVNFLSSMVNGVKALMYSADFYPEEETTEPSKFEQWLDRTFSNKKLEGLIVGLSVLLGIDFLSITMMAPSLCLISTAPLGRPFKEYERNHPLSFVKPKSLFLSTQRPRQAFRSPGAAIGRDVSMNTSIPETEATPSRPCLNSTSNTPFPMRNVNCPLPSMK